MIPRNRLRKYRVDEWHDEPPPHARKVRRLAQVLVVLAATAASALVIAHYLEQSVAQLYLGSDEVHITACTYDGGEGSVTGELVNPDGQTADLNARVEFDATTGYPTDLGTLYLAANDVPGHGTITASNTDFLLGSDFESAMQNPSRKVTCRIVGTETMPRAK